MAREHQFVLEALEPRVLLAGDPVSGVASAAPTFTSLACSPASDVIRTELAEAALPPGTSNSIPYDASAQVADIFADVTDPCASGDGADGSEAVPRALKDLPVGPAPEQDAAEDHAEAERQDVAADVGQLPPDQDVDGADEGLSDPEDPDTDSAAEQLTETLRAANGPPAEPGQEGRLPFLMAGAPGPDVTTVPTFTPAPDEVTTIEIGGTALGSYDRINVTGLAAFDGTLRIQLVNGFVPSAGNVFTIFTWGTHSGEFANWLGTTAIPGHPDLAFVPSYSPGDPGSLTLTVVQTPIVVPVVQSALNSGLTALGNVGSLLNNVGSFADNIPLIGDNLGSLVDIGGAITDVIRDRIQSLWNSLTKESEVTAAIEAWNGSTFAGFTVHVNGVLGHYGTPLVDPISWDVSIQLSPVAVNRVLQDLTAGVFGAVLDPNPSVAVTSALILDFTFGYHPVDSFFVEIDSLSAKAEVDVTGLIGFDVDLSLASLGVTGGFVNLTAAVTATPDESILTSGRITSATLSSLGVGNVADAFNLDESGTVDASLTLAGTLALGPGLQYSGAHTVRIQSADLFNGEEPDLTIQVVGSLAVLNQTLTGTFVMRKTATETVVEISNAALSLTLGPTNIRVLRATNGSGTFLLLGGDLAGTASLTIAEGPAIPNFDIAGTTLNLAFNTSNQAVTSINGQPVDLAVGDYYRVSGHAVVALELPAIELSGDFVFEPRDTAPTSGNEEVVVGVANLAFDFNIAGLDLLSVSNGFGAFIITPAGIAGTAGADVALDVEALNLGGDFTVVLNTTNAVVPARDVDVNGTSVRVSLDPDVLVALPAGPYLRVSGGDVTLHILGIGLTGNFVFEQRETSDADDVITVAASGVSFDLGSTANELVEVTLSSGAFLITEDGLAGTGTATVSLGVPDLALTGTFTVAINTNEASAVNETVLVGGVPVVINLPIGPYLQVNGTGVVLTVLGVELTGNFSFEQRVTVGGTQLVTVMASGVTFQFGDTDFITGTNGEGLFLITDAGAAGMGSMNINVTALGGGFTQPLAWAFNNLSSPIDETVDWEGTLKDIELPEGPFNRLSTGGAVPLTINVGGQPQGITAALVLTLVDVPDPGEDYVTVGVSQLSANFGFAPAGVGLTLGGGTGAFVIVDAGVAGEVKVATATLSGAGVLGVNALNLELRFNTTAGDIGNPTPILVGISDNPADDVPVQFIGQPNYIAVEGTAEITGLTGAVTLGGSFSFEKTQVDTNGDATLENVFKVGAADLHFELKAGTLSVASFHQGTGAFVITPNGVAGVAELAFEAGMIGVAGDISLEVNTTTAAVNTSVTIGGHATAINITDTEIVRVSVDGHILLGSISLPFSFTVEIELGSGNVVFKQTPPGNLTLVTIEPDGDIIPGISFDDFARPGPFEFISMLRQLLVWFETLRGSSVFELEIPFTDGTTLGDAFDWTQLFLDEIFSHLVSVELQSGSLRTVDPLTGLPTNVSGTLVDARLRIQVGTDAPAEVVLSGPYASVNDLVTLFNGALPGALSTRVIARINSDNQFVIALLPGEIAAGLALNLVDLNDEAATVFGLGPNDDTYGDADDLTPEQVGLETSLHDLESFFEAVRQVVAPLAPPIVYNAAQRLYTFTVDESATYGLDIPFQFGEDFGPIASASLEGMLHLAAEVGFTFTLGFDLGAREVPRILSSTFVPAPAHGGISADAHFQLLLNDDVSWINLTLPKSYTDGTDLLDPTPNDSIEDLAADLNRVFHENFRGGIRLDQLLVAQRAGTGLAISALQEDRDNDGHLDVDEDLDDDHVRDPGEPDVDGDGRLDTVNEDLNLDLGLDLQLGLINRIVIRSGIEDTFATELGFGITAEDTDGNPATPDDQYFVSASNSTIKGLFIDQVELNAQLTVTTTTPIEGSLRFGFVEITTDNGLLGTLNYDGTPNPLTASIGLENQTTGETRFYISDLFNSLSSDNIGNLIQGPDFSGGLLARLDDISVGGLGFSFPLGTNPEISVFIPDINDLDFNSDPYNGSNTGIFLTYPNLGNLQNFTRLNFTQIIRALQIIADNLSQLSAFSFLDEPLPLVNLSVNDMLDYAVRFADLIDAASAGGSESLQETVAELETQIELLFDLDPSVLTIELDQNGMPAASLVTASGVNGGANSTVTLTPGGDNNNLTIRTTSNSNAGDLNGTVIRLVGDPSVTDGTARAEWDGQAEVLTVFINGGVTTANAIMAAINGLSGSPWTASLATPDNPLAGNTGLGTITTVALKFHFLFEAAYANSLPFQLDLHDLVGNLAGDNAAVRAFLEAATTLVQISGSGHLTVSASAALTLDFGLDLTNPGSVRPFFYDTTGVELLAKVLGTDLEIEASLGSVFGIFIHDGAITIDADGDPETDAGDDDRGANFRLGLKDNNGDGRHYFTEDWFNGGSIDLHLQGGLRATLPIFAPFTSTALDGDGDENGDGYPDNYLVIDVPDVVRLFVSEAVLTQATGASATVPFGGNHNDLVITSTGHVNYDVRFLDTLGGGGANASFDTPTNTLTVSIDAGNTTALTALNQIKLVPTFNLSVLTPDDDGADATTTNTGAGKLEKLLLIAPDFGALFDNIDFCELLASQTGLLLDGLDAFLGSVQDGLNELVLNTDLPLIGDGLAGAANFIEDFRNGLLASLRDEVDAAGGNGVTAMENAIKKGFWSTLGPGGLDLLVDADTGEALDPALGFGQLAITLDCEDGLAVNLRLRKVAALIDSTVAFDIGVPGFGLEVDGGVQVKVGFDLKFGFGISPEEGFFFNSSAPADDPELRIFFEATIPSLHVGGQLLFLQLDVMDDVEHPSSFVGEFVVDLKDPNHDGKLTFAELGASGTEFSDIISANLQADAELNLDLAASFGGNTAFPRILAEFHLLWHFDIINGAGDPQISFTNIYLDLGTFISDFLGPVLNEIRKVTEPLQPIIDVVTARLPVLSDLAGETITLLTLAEIFGLLEPTTVDFIEGIIEVIELINDLEGLGEGSILIPFGAFSLLEDGNGERRNLAVLEDIGQMTADEIQNAIEESTEPGASETYKSQSSGFVGDVGSLDNFSIPIFDNPAELFNLFIGEPVRLVEWRMPTFLFEFTYIQKIPIYPPLYAQFGGTIGAKIDIGFGYDTFGIQKFISSDAKDPIDLFDGFYVIDFDAEGHERPELELTGEIFAGASIDLLIVEVGVRGGITATIGFDLNDVNDDGKVRVSEIIANAQQDPRCIFDIHGEIGLFLEAFLKIDLFFFSIDKTWRFAEITLFEFTITCPEPILASKDGAGVLTVHAGADAGARAEIDTNDNAETFVVTHLDGDDTSETVEVQWASWRQTYEGVTKILVRDAGKGDDLIDLRGVKVDVEVHGGAGNDTIYLSDGDGSTAFGDENDDTITSSSAISAINVVIHGGTGNDLLTAGPVAITIYGDGGNDLITGSPEGDWLYGDDGTGMSTDGADDINGGDGDDEIHGGLGNDTIEGGAGHDWVLGEGGNDTVRGSRGDDILDGGEGDDRLYGSSGNDLLIGGPDDDWANGHGGVDLLVGETFTAVNGFTLVSTNLAAIRAAVATIPAAGVTLTGLTGGDVENDDRITGNDLLIGGGDSDALFGGPGNDFLYGGNFLNTGETDIIEEDHNDFFDGGSDNDTIFGDDAMGRTGDRDTGIAIRGSIFFDRSKNGVRDGEEAGFGGVTVNLVRNDGVPIGDTKTESDGTFAFTGLDPDLYYMTFSPVAGLTFSPQFGGGAANAEAAANDSDVDGAGKTPDFELTFDETESSVTAGYEGDPLISVSDVSVVEGDAGQTQAILTVTLSGPQVFLVSVDYATADGNDGDATRNALEARGDYIQASGRLQFGPGETSKTVTVFINGETIYEPHQQLRLLLSNPSAGVKLPSVPTTTVLVTIVNDDPIPEISISDYVPPATLDDQGNRFYTVGEGDPATFVISLSNPSEDIIRVQYLVDSPYTFAGLDPDSPARPFPLFADGDFVAPIPLPIVFQPGELFRTIKVLLHDDLADPIDEPDEHFYVDLYNPEYARIADGRGYGIIPDDDPLVSVSIEPLTPIGGTFRTEVDEGSGATWTTVPMVISLSKISRKQVSVTYATSPGTAVEAVFAEDRSLGLALEDYLAFPTEATPEALRSIVFAPGQLSRIIYVTIQGDNFVEGDEMFFVNLLSAENAMISATPATESNHVTVVIKEDDTASDSDAGPWAIRFSDTLYRVQEPATGNAFVPITILRAPGSSHAIGVFYTTDGSATAGSDYTKIFRHLVVFAEHELAKTILITIHSDSDSEGDETVLLSLRNPTGGKVRGSPDTAVLVIEDEDVPAISIEPPNYFIFDPELFALVSVDGIIEGTPLAQTSTTFDVKLSKPAPPGGVFVNWETVSMTARAGLDFTGASGTVFIPANSSLGSIVITVAQDVTPELTEKFAVRLKNPVRGSLAPEDSVAIAPIYDDDGKLVEGTVFYDNNGNGFLDIGEKGIEGVDVTLRWEQFGVMQTVTVPTNSLGEYSTQVALGELTIEVDGTTVKSPYQKLAGPLAALLWSGEYASTTNNEAQAETFDGVVGISPFAPVGYKNSRTFSIPEGADDVGRGGTDDTIFGGPGDDLIDAGAGDDHVVGGHWQTATDFNMPVNKADYDAVVIVVDSSTDLVAEYGLPPGTVLHSIYAGGPIYAVTPEVFGGAISGQIWQDVNGNNFQRNSLVPFPTFDPLFTGEVMVTLLDCAGNPINSVVTINGAYSFTNLFVDDQNPSAESLYLVEFTLPNGYEFVEPNSGDADPDDDLTALDSDAELVNRTRMITISFNDPAEAGIDAGVIPSNTPTASGLAFEFSRGTYSISEQAGFVTLTIVRGTSYNDQSVLIRTYDGTGPEGAVSAPAAIKNYTAVTRLLYFAIGETIKTLRIPVFDRDLGICEFRYFTVTMHEPTGRPLDEATVYIVGEGNPIISDDDTILAGNDWDIVLGDSASIPGYAVVHEYPNIGQSRYLGDIERFGGPGDDILDGAGGADYLDGQLGDDVLAGGDTVDIVVGGLGDDDITVGQGNDDIQGDHGLDTVLSRRPVPGITLSPTALIHQRRDGSMLNTHTMHDVFEVARLFGDNTSNVFNLNSWDSSAFISGAGGADRLLVTNDTDMILRDATLLEQLFFNFFFGFNKDASLSLATGSTYHLASLENVRLTGEGGSNTFDASSYSRPVTFVGAGGNDTLIGGSAADTFIFIADAALGTDTLTGNDGRDTMTFVDTFLTLATAANVEVDLADHALQTVNGNLKLILIDDLENATGGHGHDVLRGNSLANVLLGGIGDDTLQGRGGNEVYAFDLDVSWGTETIIEDAGGGNDTLDFSGTLLHSVHVNISITTAQAANTNLTLVVQDSGGGEGEIENILGGARDDVLRGNTFANTLRGGPGEDVLDGKSGDDILDGGPGNDELDGGLGTDTINEVADTHFTLNDHSLARGTGEVDQLENIEVANLVGGVNPNTFNLTGWTGTGSLDGADDPDAPRLDTVVVNADATFAVTDVKLTVSTMSAPIALLTYPVNQPSIDIVMLTDGPGSHTLDASAFNGSAILIGNDGDDILIGGSGPDLLRGGLGLDKLTGNRGNDLLDGGSGTDQIIETLSAAAADVDFVLQNNKLSIVQDPDAVLPAQPIVEFDLLFNLEIADVTGSAQDDSFDVSGWTAGTATVRGGAGVNTVEALVTEAGTITLSDTAITFTGGAGTIHLISIQIAFLTGSDGDDELDARGFTGAARLNGGLGNDTLRGGPGLNILDGGPGDDRFIFQPDGALDLDGVIAGEGEDTLDFSLFAAGVTVNLSILAAVQPVAAGELSLVLTSAVLPAGEEVEIVIGGGGNDTLTGNALNNTLTGGPGADNLNGSGGTDTLLESADANMILTDGSLSIGGIVDVLAGFETARLTGGAGANDMNASAFTHPARLDGGAGADVLTGGLGSDLLIGGAGDDKLVGGPGDDRYEFDVDDVLGADTLEELPGGVNGNDTLDFSPTTTRAIVIDLGSTGVQVVHATNLRLTLSNAAAFENVLAGALSDTLIGNSLDNILGGGAGNDIIKGAGGVLDRIFEARDADFTLTDTLLKVGATEEDILTDIDGAVLLGGEGQNILDASAFTLGPVLLLGAGGDDILLGGYGDDALRGGEGNDILFGGGGADDVRGEAGDDLLGGSGTVDLLIGSDGDDALRGGTGNDTYIFDQSFDQGTDTVLEFLNQGFNDVLQGVGPGGIAIQLHLAGVQVIGLDLNLSIILGGVLGEVEHSF